MNFSLHVEKSKLKWFKYNSTDITFNEHKKRKIIIMTYYVPSHVKLQYHKQCFNFFPVYRYIMLRVYISIILTYNTLNQIIKHLTFIVQTSSSVVNTILKHKYVWKLVTRWREGQGGLDTLEPDWIRLMSVGLRGNQYHISGVDNKVGERVQGYLTAGDSVMC